MDADLKRKKKKVVQKTQIDDNTKKVAQMISNVNPNVNVFSQLSAIYQQNHNIQPSSSQKQVEINENLLENKLEYFDPDVQKILKQLNKKSEVTKQKALQELLQKISSNNNSDFYEVFLPTFIYMYKQYMKLENDKQLLLTMNLILLEIIKKKELKKCIGNNYKELFPYWFIQMNDKMIKEVQVVAIKSFKLLFGDKTNQAILKCQFQFLQQFKVIMQLNSSTIINENSNLVEQQAFNILDRLQIASISALLSVLNIYENDSSLKNEQYQKLVSQLQQDLQLEQIQTKQHYINNIYNDKNREKVKGYILQLFMLVIKQYDENIDEKQKVYLVKQILSNVDNNDRHVQHIQLSSNVIEVLKYLKDKQQWKLLDNSFINSFQKQLLTCIDNSGFGNGELLYNNIIIIFSMLPVSDLQKNDGKLKDEENVKQKIQYIQQFIVNVIKGYDNEECRFYSEQLTKTIFDIIFYFLSKKVNVDLLFENQNLFSFFRNQLIQILNLPLDIYIKNNQKKNTQMNQYSHIPTYFAKLIENLKFSHHEDQLSKLVQLFLDELINYFVNKCQNEEMIQNYCNIIQEINRTVTKNCFHKEMVRMFVQKNIQVLIEMLNQNIQALSNPNQIKQNLEQNQIQILKILRTLIESVLSQFSCFIPQQLKANCYFQSIVQIVDQLYRTRNNSLHQYLGHIVQQMVQVEDMDIVFEQLMNLDDRLFITAYSSLLNQGNDMAIEIEEDKYEQFEQLRSIVHRTKKMKKQNFNSIFQNNQLFQSLFQKYYKILSENYEIFEQQFTYLFQYIRFYSEQQTCQNILQNVCTIQQQIKQHCEQDANYIDDPKCQQQQYTLNMFYLILENKENDQQEVQIYNGLVSILYLQLQQQNQTIYQQSKLIFDSIQQKMVDSLYPLIVEFVELKVQQAIRNEKENRNEDLYYLESYLELLIELLLKYQMKDKLIDLIRTTIFSKFTECNFNYKTIYMLCQRYLSELDGVVETSAIIDKEYLEQNRELTFVLLSSQNSVALIKDMELKNYYCNISNSYVLQSLIEQSENEFNSFKEFINYLYEVCQSKNLIFTQALNNILVQVMLTSNIGSEKQSELVNMLLEKVKLILNNKVDKEQGIKMMYITKTIFNSLAKQLNSDQQITTVQKETEDLIVQSIDGNHNIVNVIFQIDFFTQTLKINRQENIDETRLEKIVQYIFREDNVDELVRSGENYPMGVVFDFINVISEMNGFIYFSDQLLQIEQLNYHVYELNQSIQKYFSQSIQQVLIFDRKVLNFLEAFSNEFQQFIKNKLLKIMNSIQLQIAEMISDKSKNDSLIVDENSNQMIIEIAETISRLSAAQQIYNDIIVDEDLLISIMNSQFESIQKSIFFLLNYLYKNIALYPMNFEEIVDNTAEEKQEELFYDYQSLFSKELFNTITMNLKILDRQNHKINRQIINYLYGWLILINKHDSQAFLQNENQKKMDLNKYQKKVIINMFEQEQSIYFRFVNNLFSYLMELGFDHENKLKSVIEQSELKNLLENEFIADNVFNRKNMAKLIIKVLFQFSSSFPYYIRKWIQETEKKYMKMGQGIIKTFVSQAIFHKEIQQIELRQEQWRSDEFNIEVFPNTKEIKAIYVKEDSKLEINIQIPSDYPLRLIEVQNQKGLVLNENKVKKFNLMMRSLLAQQNNSLVDSLLLWKNNIDLEFEGIENCYICYSIIHATSKQLPKLACKTCKHKFHSACIQKWFHSSNKSECPLCKSQFL